MVSQEEGLMNDNVRVPDVIDELRDQLEQNGGVVTLRMKELKTLSGAQRLGHRIREQLEDALHTAQIGFFPDPLPASENDSVRIYELGTELAELIEAVRTLDEDADEQLRSFVDRNTSEER